MSDITPMESMDSEISSYPVLPLRDIVVFPKMIASLFVGRERSIKALDMVMQQDKKILLLTQKQSDIEDPTEDDLYHVGVVTLIKQMLKLPDGTVKILVEGERRVRVKVVSELDGAFYASVSNFPDSDAREDSQLGAMVPSVIDKVHEYAKHDTRLPSETLNKIKSMTQADDVMYALVPHLDMPVGEKQSLLEQTDMFEKLQTIYVFLSEKIDVHALERRLSDHVKEQMEKNQREYYLNEKAKAIGKELGDDVASEIDAYKTRIENSRMPADAKEKALNELKKLRSMPPVSAESAVIRMYIDWILDVPWKKRSRVNTDLSKAEQVLGSEHFGLEKVKERILEYLAVGIRTKKMRGPILCFVGPPGVGKTSLAKSIAKACGRKYVRISLGGVRDESEIRGHRRTYVGSMPGRIIQGMKKAGTSNPLFLLDEIDKIGMDHRGDPASALLEVLDPAQNKAFSDHYMEVDYDLSDVMFVTTANVYDMPSALRDRMEIITLSGYTEDEKVEIVRQHLLTRALDDTGLKHGEVDITNDAVLYVIRRYTRESGVRNLQREIQRLCRKGLKHILTTDVKTVSIDIPTVQAYLGVEKYAYGEVQDQDAVGVVTGLAWTSVGGDILQIEAALVHGKGKLQKTGKLGTVMQESISAAETYVRSQAPDLGVLKGVYEKRDIHIHVPEGATPKDGPSAGIAMVTAMVSVLTDIPVQRDVAMTGEITLHGKVLAIGGLKEKLLAALRAGIKTAIIPQENEKDLQDIPDIVKQGLRIIPVMHVSEVLKIALTKQPHPVQWEDEDLSILRDSLSNTSPSKYQ